MHFEGVEPKTSTYSKRRLFMTRKRWVCSIAACVLSAATLAYAEQTPQELLQYISDARKAGLKDAQIEQNAIQAGWQKAVVGDAIQSGAKTKPAQASDLQPTAATPAATVAPPLSPSPAAAVKEEGGTQAKATDRGVPENYAIGEGDILHVSVWKEPDASVQSVVVRPDGKITLPMLKELYVSGMTPTQAEKVITEQLTKFINTPDVTVIVSGINSKKIYVVGAVKKEGPIPYTYRMTILQALSEAGGLTDYAKKKKIYVLRHEGGRDYQLPFDYDAALKGERMELNIPLLPGDTLVIPK
jgi:polysaccharide export outer membrane protein